MILPVEYRSVASIILDGSRTFRLRGSSYLVKQGEQIVGELKYTTRTKRAFQGKPTEHCTKTQVEVFALERDFEAERVLSAIARVSTGVVLLGDVHQVFAQHVLAGYGVSRLLTADTLAANGFFATDKSGKPHYLRLAQSRPGLWNLALPAGLRVLLKGTHIITTRPL